MSAARTVSAMFQVQSDTVPVTVTLLGTGRGTVTGPGISCTTGSTAGCSARFPITTPRTTVTLVASDVVEMFGGWTGCTTVNDMTCVVEITGAKTVSAEFVGMPGPP
jgi:hypothetical protein